MQRLAAVWMSPHHMNEVIFAPADAVFTNRVQAWYQVPEV
jgi:hypothetical protein